MTSRLHIHALTTLTIALLMLMACTPTPSDVKESDLLPPMYPDYTDITIPHNIAPLNFLLRQDAEAVEVRATCEDEELRLCTKGNKVCFGMSEWKSLMEKAKGKRVKVTVTILKDQQWTAYKTFFWDVSEEAIDPYLTYRLIEPDYEIYQNLSLRERCVENFDERPIADYGLVGNRCMNCHTYGGQSPQLSMLYVRGEGGGAILNQGGKHP